MNRDRIIKLTASVAMVSIVLLVYWVVIFVSISVFGLKIFRQNTTEMFYASILGILAILGGALITNVILNLSKIGEALSRKNDGPPEPARPMHRGRVIAFLLSFPVLFVLLYLGNYATSVKKRNYLVGAAKKVVELNRAQIDQMASYSFQASYVDTTARYLKRISEEEENFPSVSLLLSDTVDDRPTILQFTRYTNWRKDDSLQKDDLLFPCSAKEREYLMSVLSGKRSDYRFSANHGAYELYYPIKKTNRILVLYFSSQSAYGKIGS